MKNLHITNSFLIWAPSEMKEKIVETCMITYDHYDAAEVLGRTWAGMYIEWWLHNIGYYLTKPFPFLNFLTERFQHVDLNSW